MQLTPRRIKNFFKKIYYEPNTGCWLWSAHCNDRGYGTFQLGRAGGPNPAHRVSWVIHKGAIPKKLWVLHKCDVPSCVNPDHLFLGTPKDNTWDMINKKRAVYNPPLGSKNGLSKLTEDQVREMRKLRKELNFKHSVLAKLFNITEGRVSMIIQKKSWAHVKDL